ncbi:MAG TPA: UDP-N-acetylmuramate:L-alanyl-gamma-D-glutamyl-meso-diaminopimelate ligase [Steroidobacteraceae bacterium]|nr:UDP-N-acetylmuramate:L-alanyl-gamma-D-glutamyl-meso-diaminopimelate ligase [Steroidobacteraceae bacterium]
MHLHILGICGSFMGGIAAIARAAGHQVTGSDQNVYPPMSTQLESLGIRIVQGHEAAQLDLQPDVVVVGNVMSRGMPVVEALLDSRIPFASGPEWLSRTVLRDRWVLAVAGTHGKTTTASLLAHILDHAGLDPGFLIGGVPGNFVVSARLGSSPFFVIEADEYDTAFFDKRAKFVHYQPRTLVLNNLEFDHADIYQNLEAIKRQFSHLLRIVPGNGLIVHNAADANLDEVIARGCWTPRESFAQGNAGQARWAARLTGADHARFEVLLDGVSQGTVAWQMLGAHNVDNALAAIVAARHAGVPVAAAIEALAAFKGVRRRMELTGEAAGIRIYDDFAHHPTAIATTIEGLRRNIGKARLVAVLEARSNTMRMGVHKQTLAPALAGADAVYLFAPPDLGWDAGAVAQAVGPHAATEPSVEALLARLERDLATGDQVLIMSNGGFGGLHAKLLSALRARA